MFRIIFSIIIFSNFINTTAQNTNDLILLKKIITREINKYPEIEIQDIYKLLHQAAMGSEHAVKDTSSVRQWMENEIAGLDWNYKENIIDTISPGGKIVRVNLRPYLKAGYSPDKLLNAFTVTANYYKGSVDILEKYIDTVMEMIINSEIKFSKSEAIHFFKDVKNKKYPAVHHSKNYEEKYSPAYRVVSEEYISFLK